MGYCPPSLPDPTATLALDQLTITAWQIVQAVAAIRGSCPFCRYDTRCHEHELTCPVTTARRISDIYSRCPPPPNYARDYRS